MPGFISGLCCITMVSVPVSMTASYFLNYTGFVIIWNQEVWCLQLCSFSGFLWLSGVFCGLIWILGLLFSVQYAMWGQRLFLTAGLSCRLNSLPTHSCRMGSLAAHILWSGFLTAWDWRLYSAAGKDCELFPCPDKDPQPVWPIGWRPESGRPPHRAPVRTPELALRNCWLGSLLRH